MRVQLRKRSILACTAAAAAAALSMAYVQATAPGDRRVSMSPPPWDSFSANLSIRQAHVDADGRPLREPPPAILLRIERARTASGWTTAMTLRGIEKPITRSTGGARELENPFLVSRIEYDEDGSAPRLFNGRGERIRSPDRADRALLAVPRSAAAPVNWDVVAGRIPGAGPVLGDDWIDSIAASPEKRGKRHASLEQRFGKSHGRVRGFDRYTSSDGDLGYELLVDPDADVPVEMNVSRSGNLVSHNVFGHVATAGGVLVRRSLRAEQMLPEGKGARSVTEVEMSDVVLTKRSDQ